uniref:BTB domain-containing protein n=1 Tax=Rhizochromulina marina TaxID=1034831 RepID=A0A7S2RRK5_9STRA|mmetsp:Transcript_19505/g.56895  ORF Transcript_19505/g.56895 Transcript_19505/m.56895 type:complete len:892 (+) Transcript_19505:124-2799(+)
MSARDGFAFGWGSSRWGQLGEASPSRRPVLEPLVLPSLEGGHVVSTAGGEGHSLVVTGAGTVFSAGRGHEGQLGHGDKEDVHGFRQVTALSDEVVLGVACGALHSVCRTSGGRVFMWGLIHAEKGQTTEAGEAGSDGAAAGDARQMLGITGHNATLHRIVQDSTTRWLTARDDVEHGQAASEHGAASSDEHRLAAEGFGGGGAAATAATAGAAAAEEGAGAGTVGTDEGIIHMDARRCIVLQPVLCTSLQGHRISMVSAGFGHTLALTEGGRVFSCGYNDRGQLGLGHRMNSSSFQLVRALANKRCSKIVCGQQHNLALVSVAPDHEVVFTWGNGALGQLGLGRSVTGRRTPVVVPGILAAASPADNEDKGKSGGLAASAEPAGLAEFAGFLAKSVSVVDIAAGANHSVCVVSDGSVFTWGHGEYGQHGSASSVSTSDLVDAFHYYVPQKLEVDADFVQVSCGACFTLGLTREGQVWSWGWNSHGVLGHGKGFFSYRPMEIQKLACNDRTAISISAGYNHCLAIVGDSGSASAMQLRQLLNHLPSADLKLTLPHLSECYFAHRAIVESRSAYLRGFIQSALDAGDAQYERVEVPPEETHPGIPEGAKWVLHVQLTVLEDVSRLSVAAFLHFLYTDRLQAPPHKLVEVGHMAESLFLPRLASLCWSARGNHRVKIPPSDFEVQMDAAVDDPRFADVFFAVGGVESSLLAGDAAHAVAGGGGGGGRGPPAASIAKAEEHSEALSERTDGVWAYSALLRRVDYFGSLLSGKFKTSVVHLSPHQVVQVVDISGLIADGIQLSTFKRVIRFIYSGSPSVIPVDDPTLVTELVVAAERLGVAQLVLQCEKLLVNFLQDERENAIACAPFALRHNLRRLAKHCKDILASTTEAPTTGG